MTFTNEKEFFDLIQELISSKDFEQAKHLLSHFPENYSKKITAEILFGIILYKEFAYREALEHFKQILRRLPIEHEKIRANVRYHLARCNLVLDFEVTAEQEIKEALEIDPENMEFFEFYIKLLKIQQRYSDIIELVPSNLEMFSNSCLCLNFLAESYISHGDCMKAEGILAIAQEILPDFKLTLINLAIVAKERDNRELEEQYLKAAIKSEKYHDDYEIFLPWEQLMKNFEEMNKFEELTNAKAQFNQVLQEFREKHPNSDV